MEGTFSTFSSRFRYLNAAYCRFIEDQNLRFGPQCGSKHNLDLLTAREALDLVILSNVAIQAKID